MKNWQSKEGAMRKNHILIDFENVQPESLAALDAEHFHVIVFCGANQTKVPLDLAMALQKIAPRARYIRVSGSGSNALDFHIAFYIGELAAADPAAYFHVISKDKGFDPLMDHLKSRGISALRSTAVRDIPLIKATGAKTPEDRLQLALANLRQRGSALPRTVKTLSSTLSALFNKQLEEKEVFALVESLAEEGLIAISGTKVTYTLAPKKP
jgi:hypothetical protein